MGIFSQLLLAFLLVSLLPLAAYWSIQSSQTAEAERSKAEASLRMFSAQLVQHVNDWTDLNLRVLQTAAASPAIRSLEGKQQQPVVDAVARNLPWTYLIHTLDPWGRNIARSDGAALTEYSFRDYFQKVMDGAPYFAEVQIGITSGLPAFLMSVPIAGHDGGIGGVLAQAATLEEVTRAVSDVRIGQSGFAFLTTASGKLIAHPGLPMAQELLDFSDHPAVRVAETTPPRIRRYRHQAKDRLAVVGRTELGWIVVAQQDAAESLAGLHRANHMGTLLLGATAVAVILLSMLVARGFARPINRVTELAHRISRGELNETSPSRRPDQIGDLQRAMGTMTLRLKRSIDELTLSRSLVRATLEHLPQGVSVVDANLRLLAWNRRYLELFKYPPEKVHEGASIETLMRHNAEQGLFGERASERDIQRRLEQLRLGIPHLHERTLPNGTTLEIRGGPLPGTGYVTSFSDVTEYKTTENKLRALTQTLEGRVRQRTADLERARAEAVRANRAKSHFLAAAVHDLTQPITAARMYLGLLESATQNADQRTLTHNANSALASIENVFSGLTELARFESDKLKPHLTHVALVELFETLEREFGPAARKRRLRLRFAHSSLVVRSDATLLYRVVQNFISNALRYTRAGGVLVGARRHGNYARIEVWDTGPGIPLHRQDEIFDEFRRLDSGFGHRESGSGLGLTIVKNIAEALGHSVVLRSEPGRGSVFSIEAPLARGGGHRITARPAPGNASLQGKRIWCVDDHAAVRRSMVRVLRSWGCRTRSFASARSLVSFTQKETPPDLLIIDYRIGDDDGLKLLATLDSIWKAKLPALLITGEPESTIPDQSRAPVLRKPIAPATLQARILELVK